MNIEMADSFSLSTRVASPSLNEARVEEDVQMNETMEHKLEKRNEMLRVKRGLCITRQNRSMRKRLFEEASKIYKKTDTRKQKKRVDCL